MTLTPVLTAHWDEADSYTMAGYRRHGGYAQLEKGFAMDPDALIQLVKDSGLRGRGGAGFPTGMKWGFVPQGDGTQHYLVVNADESEPGACKDIPLMLANPHALVEGCILTSYAIRANWGFIYVRGEVPHVHRRLRAAVREAYAAGYLGKNIMGTGFDLDLVVHSGAGAYICGEETALLDSLEGKRGNPRLKPPFPAIQGLYDGPTLINNVETLMNLPNVVNNGPDWFKSFGTEQSTGTKVVSVSGCVRRPGNYEIELGIPSRDIIYGLAGGPPEGRELKAWYPGGSSAPVLGPEELDLPYSFEAMAEAGSMLGSGAIIVADDSVSIAEMALRTARFYRHESCGKCSPCREGTNWTVKMLERVVRGEATPMDLDIIASVQENIIGHCLCVLGDAMAMPVGSMVRRWRSEFEETIARAREAGPAPLDVEPAVATPVGVGA